jgi:Tfp pilus assembly protein PilF
MIVADICFMNRLLRATVYALAGIVLFGQPQNSSTLEGLVRDPRGKPVTSAAVLLKTNSQTFTTQTDSQGSYRFKSLPAGSYSLHASASGQGEADLGPIPLGLGETETINLTLDSSAKPQFFDEPSFIVAGVTDPAQRGGHGSDPALRSTEALARETASLRTSSPAATKESLIEAIVREPDQAGLHHSLADIEEKQGNALEAAREYQRAAELDPSETNLFDWGAELLVHRAADQAVEVFSKTTRLFPRSPRTLLGLAVAYYSRGSYDQASQRFFEATDLNPADPAPYLFLGKVSSGAITDSQGFAERMERFARLQPGNALANYYYAVSLWKRRNSHGNAAAKVRTLLERAVSLDTHLAAAYLQLGIVFADQSNFPKAIVAYEDAIAASPATEEAHYRLAQVYRKTGQPAKAQREGEIYQQLSKQSAQESERERAEIQQFVFELKHQ